MTFLKEASVLEWIARERHGERAASVLALRPKQIDLMERAYRSLFEHTEPGGLSAAECAFLAERTSSVVGETHLAAHYRALADQQPHATPIASLDARAAERRSVLLRHLQRVALCPSDVKQQNVAELTATGLTATEIVTSAQIAAFVSYQARVLAGLRIFALPTEAPTDAHDDNDSPSATERNFTLAKLRWQPWIEPVVFANASAGQIDALAECGVPARDSAYFRVLAHAPASLRERTRLYNALLFDSGGLSRAEREFATVAVSRVNGCVYCASVHARRFAELTKTTEPIRSFLQHGDRSQFPPRLQAVQRFAHKLTQAPERLDGIDLARLEEAGFVRLEILDLIQASALFAWANRLMLTLGQPDFNSEEIR